MSATPVDYDKVWADGMTGLPSKSNPFSNGSLASNASNGYIEGADPKAETNGSLASNASNGYFETLPAGNPEGSLERAREWFGRYITVVNDDDLDVLALWSLHTWLLDFVPVSPRLLIDSIMPGSGKTTVLEHMARVALHPMMMSEVSSASLLVRVLNKERRTFLVDEVDRALDPKRDSTGSLLAIINSGYKPGATRPVNCPSSNGGWDFVEMPTYSAVAMAGNSPLLPDDTMSRSLRIYLLPDLNEEAEETDWTEEDFEQSARQVGGDLYAWANLHADEVKAARPEFPHGCKGRVKERWVAFARIAQVVGGNWPSTVRSLIEQDINREQQEREDGMKSVPPRMQAPLDVAEVLKGRGFVPTAEIVERLIELRPDMWADRPGKGRLTVQGLGRMLSKAGVFSCQEGGGQRRRGYREDDVNRLVDRLTGASTPSQSNRSNRSNRPDRASEDEAKEDDSWMDELLGDTGDDSPSAEMEGHPEVTEADLDAYRQEMSR